MDGRSGVRRHDAAAQDRSLAEAATIDDRKKNVRPWMAVPWPF